MEGVAVEEAVEDAEAVMAGDEGGAGGAEEGPSNTTNNPWAHEEALRPQRCDPAPLTLSSSDGCICVQREA